MRRKWFPIDPKNDARRRMETQICQLLQLPGEATLTLTDPDIVHWRVTNEPLED